MALIHYLYIGHFVTEDGFVRFQDRRPFALQPINEEVVAQLLEKHLGQGISPDQLDKDWGIAICPDYIVCEYGGPPQSLRFAAEYAEQEDALILEFGSFSLRTPEQVRQFAALSSTG